MRERESMTEREQSDLAKRTFGANTVVLRRRRVVGPMALPEVVIGRTGFGLAVLGSGRTFSEAYHRAVATDLPERPVEGHA
jgi:hypothetical protein